MCDLFLADLPDQQNYIKPAVQYDRRAQKLRRISWTDFGKLFFLTCKEPRDSNLLKTNVDQKLIKWRRGIQEDGSYLMVWISFHINVRIYLGSSQSQEAMARIFFSETSPLHIDTIRLQVIWTSAITVVRAPRPNSTMSKEFVRVVSSSSDWQVS